MLAGMFLGGAGSVEVQDSVQVVVSEPGVQIRLKADSLDAPASGTLFLHTSCCWMKSMAGKPFLFRFTTDGSSLAVGASVRARTNCAPPPSPPMGVGGAHGETRWPVSVFVLSVWFGSASRGV